eukprot:scaffold150524_cov51-Attheya_sp.AAC.2
MSPKLLLYHHIDHGISGVFHQKSECQAILCGRDDPTEDDLIVIARLWGAELASRLVFCVRLYNRTS